MRLFSGLFSYDYFLVLNPGILPLTFFKLDVLISIGKSDIFELRKYALPHFHSNFSL